MDLIKEIEHFEEKEENLYDMNEHKNHAWGRGEREFEDGEKNAINNCIREWRADERMKLRGVY